MADLHSKDQAKIFANYQSLDLANKIYQAKSLKLAEDHCHRGGANILDLGCADGSFIKHAAQELNATPFGLDISPKAVKQAQGIGVNAAVANFESPLPLPDNHFDLIFVLEVIEHIYDTDQLISEAYRLLKPHGTLILSTPNLASLKNRIRLLFNLYPENLEYSRQGAGHIHLYTLKVLTNQIMAHKFFLLSASAPNFPFPLITHPRCPSALKDAAIRLGDIYPALGSHLIVTAQK